MDDEFGPVNLNDVEPDKLPAVNSALNTLLAQLRNCVSANYANALHIKRNLENGVKIDSTNFDLNMIIDRSWEHIKE